ncbi:MAG: DHA2 family efflux MFS transporter permease subunit [Jatrophihabitans sp.]|uniref:DHA2 family efflux MFS transporter permease subunit n=1 Tax=Jatrophihabitans sp. TaxID=1932789 RepID=UPI00391334C7
MVKPSQPPRAGLVLAVLSVAAFMASLDVFIVNVAFDSIGADFPGTSLSALSWVLNAYAVVFAALLVPAGRLADRYGRRTGFVLGLAVFTAASAACAASDGIWTLVAFRAVQAVGAALLTPASLGLVLASSAPEHRARSVKIWAASGAVAAALGPVFGGLLVDADWRWVFLVNVPVGIVAIGGALRWAPRSRDESVTTLPDLLGAALLAVSVGVLSLGLVKGPDWGWGAGRTEITWLIAVVSFLLFVGRSRQHPSPVVSPALLRVRAFAWSNATALLFAIAFAAALLSVVLYLQQVWHYSPIRTGLAVAPGPMMVPVVAALAHRLAARVPIGVVVAAGCLALGGGSLMIAASVGRDPAYASALLPGWLVGGVGVGLALPSILSAATSDLPPAEAATGSGVISMNRQIGTAIGVSLIVAVLGTPADFAAAHTAFRHAWWALASVTVVAAVAAIGMTPRGPRSGEPGTRAPAWVGPPA